MREIKLAKPIQLKKILLYIVIILYLVFLFFRGSMGTTYYSGYILKYKPGGSDLSAISMYMATVFFVLLGLNAFCRRYKYFSSFQLFNLYLFMSTILIWIVISIYDIGVMSLLAKSISPITFIICLGIFVGLDDNLWETIKNCSFYIAFGCICAAFFYIIYYITTKDVTRMSNSPQIIYLSTGFWPLAIATLCNDYKSKIKQVLLSVLLLMCLITSAIYVSRGWIIQSLILIILYIIKKQKEKGKHFNLFKFVIMIGFILIIVYLILTIYFPDYVILITERLYDDTRTWQFKELFSQYSLKSLIIGNGISATYSTTFYGDFQNIDNHFVMILFHYGIVMMLCYLFIIISPIWRLLKTRLEFSDKLPAIILIMWFFAANGVSVYNSPMLDIKTMLIMVLVGRCYKITYAVKH